MRSVKRSKLAMYSVVGTDSLKMQEGSRDGVQSVHARTEIGRPRSFTRDTTQRHLSRLHTAATGCGVGDAFPHAIHVKDEIHSLAGLLMVLTDSRDMMNMALDCNGGNGA